MGAPEVRIVRGSPDDAELAALVAVLSAVGAAADKTVVLPARLVPRPRRFQVATSWRAAR
ncbi:acyl-CoA carboxylase subunit epsilon [Amycolatopsis saalfeldensis]|uniref:Acyl-CoA carboxylase epsilon subunit n=1 Tax=Amycolatopsis saalfeldensis TaxID=394193 RepID=A0A1H8PZV1_9PSEU|nr:acyl-CoA carboxylase subunit epsilon [Amycolatopsis saalfeldensis]SEO47460.1 Acyl-CoA carboxylase epsilon subunit [Amycolatopsis saalfeldensis]